MKKALMVTVFVVFYVCVVGGIVAAFVCGGSAGLGIGIGLCIIPLGSILGWAVNESIFGD